MTVIYTRDQAMAAIKEAFAATKALRFDHASHLDNLVVAVYDKLPAGLGQRGTLAAFIDGYCAAGLAALQEHELDFVYWVDATLYGGTGSDGFKRPSVDKVAHLDPSQVQVAFLWRHSQHNFTQWSPLSSHIPKVQP